MPTTDQHPGNSVAAPVSEDGPIGRKVRLLVAHNVSRERTGGMSRIMGLIHDEVARSEQWQVDWFCADRLNKRRNGPLARLDFPSALCRFLLREWKQGRRYDIVNVHEPVAALPIALRRFFGNPKIVVTSHGLESRAWEVDQEEARLGRYPLPWRSRVGRPLTILWPARFALRRADHIFCLNNGDLHQLTEIFRVPPARITRIFPGAERVFATSKRDYTNCNRIVFSGTWRQHKGTRDLVSAFTQLGAGHPNLTLVVLGAGVSADTVRAAFPAEMRARVEVLPSVNAAGAAQTLAESHIFVLPSLFEGTPLTLIEAMASGLPIVTTATCGMRDVIRHNENGLLVPVRSTAELVTALDSLITNYSLRERLGQAAFRDAAEHYRWSDAAQPPLRAYRSLCFPSS